MAITVPTVDTEISASAYGKPVAEWINAYTPTTWTNGVLQNSWVTFPGYQPAQYRKVGDMVQVRGVIAYGTLNALAFVLPSGYRPILPMIIPALSGSLVAVLIINADGSVIPQVGKTNDWFTLAAAFSVLP